MSFSKLQNKDGGLYITSKRVFNPQNNIFKKESIEKVFDFAFDMTFGKIGEHRDHRTGGTHQRHNGEIFANTFQGKLAECAVCNLFWKYDKTLLPDFSKYNLGIWDSVDIIANGKKLSVKSTKSIGNLLLLETKDWDANGRYIPTANQESDEKAGIYDFTLLIRIDPSCEDILKVQRLLYSDECSKEQLKQSIESKTWRYDFAGYITLDELKSITSSSKNIIHKDTMLNGRTKMDAENFYIQSGDMHDCLELGRIIYG